MQILDWEALELLRKQGEEKALQKEYQKIWLPPPVKHDPWSD